MKSTLDVLKAANPIFEIQINLRDIAEYNPDIPMIIPTGTYDAQTQRAVSEFQKNLNLPVTGTVNFMTWSAIMAEHKKTIQNKKEPSNVCCYPSNINEFKIGDKGNLIYILQILLKNHNRKYKNYLDVQLTGLFDEQTEAALKEFQKYSKLPVTGILDKQTWNTINKINSICKLYE